MEFVRGLRYAARSLRKSIGLTSIIVVILAVGIGANVVIFGAVNVALLRPLPFSGPDRLVSIWPDGAFPRRGYAILRDSTKVFENVSGYSQETYITLTGLEEPLRLRAAFVTTDFFSTLGVKAVAGRPLMPGDDNPDQGRVAVLSLGLWRAQFGERPDVLGSSIQLDGNAYTIVGIVPAQLHVPSSKVQLWLPAVVETADIGLGWGGPASLKLVGRLRVNTTIEQAGSELRAILPRIRAGYPWPMPANYGKGATVISLSDHIIGDVRLRLLILLAAVGAVLLIVCVNVANLLITRASVRKKEIAIRLAIGAQRRQLIQQLLYENVLLAMLGGALGLLLAYSGIALVKHRIPLEMSRLEDIDIDGRVLLFALSVTFGTVLLFGLLPAFHGSRPDLQRSLQESARGGGLSFRQSRLSRFLVTVEIALAVLVVICSGLLLRSFWSLSTRNLGFRTENLMAAEISPPEFRFKDDARLRNFYRDLGERVRGLPAVEGVSFSNGVPFGGPVSGAAFEIEGRPIPKGADWPFAEAHLVVGEDFLRVLGVRLLRGRWFTAADTAEAPPIVAISATLARRHWPNELPVGKRIKLPGPNPWLTIVGVVDDIKLDRMIGSGDVPVLYRPLEQGVVGPMWILARTASAPKPLEASLRQIVSSLDAGTPVSSISTMKELVASSLVRPWFTAVLLAVFGALALALGALGVYGLTEYSVAQRTQEFAVRMAFGAERRQVLFGVLRQTLSLVGLGLLIGLAIALASARFLSSLVYGISARDPLTFILVPIVLAGVALLASIIPARRATRVQPVTALRAE